MSSIWQKTFKVQIFNKVFRESYKFKGSIGEMQTSAVIKAVSNFSEMVNYHFNN